MRILIAARLSCLVKKGDGRYGGGIETQDERVREWCEREGHTVVDVIKDTKSGTVAPWRRKNLKPWFTDPELMALFEAIAVYKMDRLSRADWGDEVQIRQWAEANGKKLIIIDGPWWPPRPNTADRITWEIYTDQARKEWENILERTGRARARRDAKDSFSGKNPWGYDIVGRHPGQLAYEDKIIVPNALGRKWIPLIFQRCVDGWGVRKICNWLTAEGVPHEQGDGAWGYNTVRKMLQNTIYIGEHRKTTGKQKGKLIRNYEPIIDEDLFYAAQAAMKNRHDKPRGPVNEETRAMAAEVLLCMFDGSHMYRTGTSKPQGANGATNRYYKCASSLGWKTGQKSDCPNSIREDALNNVVDELMKRKTRNIFKKVAISNDRAGRLEKVEADLDHLRHLGLDDEAEDAERKRLRAKRDELKAPPAEEVGSKDIDTGIRYCDQWAELGDNDQARGRWLRETGSVIYACPGYKDTDDQRLFAAIGRPGCPIQDGQQLPDKIFGVYIKADLMPKMLEETVTTARPWELAPGELGALSDTPEEVVDIDELDRLVAHGRTEWAVGALELALT